MTAKTSRWSGSFGLVIKEQRGKQRLPGRLKGQRFDLSTHQAALYFQFLTIPCEVIMYLVSIIYNFIIHSCGYTKYM